MGLSIWPRYPFILLVLGLCLPTQAYQIVPDDIAFKPAAETDTPTATDIQAEPVIEETLDEIIADEIIADETITTDTSESTQTDTELAEAGQPQPKPVLSQCKIHSQWKKTLTITAMPRLIPNQSNAGNFYHAETYIPQMVAKELEQSIGAKSQLISQQIPAQWDEQTKRRQVQKIALQEGTQFVLSGEIVDMSMRDDASVYSPHFLQALRNHFTDITMMKFSDNRNRVFSLRLELRDGFTGEMLLADSFHTNGIWKNPNPVGFSSPALWQSQYGRRIQQLIRKAGNQVAENLQCQPYMARVDVYPGQTELLLQGGANNGLHPGDQLKLYQMVVMASPSEYEVYQTRLIKRDLQLQLKEVYPSHSLAQLQGDDLLNGQYLAVGED